MDYHRSMESKEIKVQGNMSHVQTQGINVQSSNTDIDIEKSEIDTLNFSVEEENVKLEGSGLHAHNVHAEQTPSASLLSEEEKQKRNSLLVEQLGSLIDDVDLEASVPLTGQTPSRFLYGKKDTTAHIKTKIQDGIFVPGAFDIRLDKDIKAPLFLGFRGTYLDKKGRLRANITNFFDVGIGNQIAKQLDLKQEDLSDISELTESIAQKILEDNAKNDDNKYIEADQLKANADIHLQEGNIELNENTHIEFGGGEEYNHIQMEADLQKEIVLKLQDILLKKIDMQNEGVELTNSILDDAQVEFTPEKSTIVDIESFDADSFSCDPKQSKK